MKKPAVELKSKTELASMFKAGQLAGQTLIELRKIVEPGITTRELDRFAEIFIRKNGGIPTFIGYRGYPATICVSINEEVVHGIPGKRRLMEGDVVSIDIAATVEGFVGDTAISIGVPPVSTENDDLIRTTDGSLSKAIDLMLPGNRLGDIGWAIQEFCESRGFGVVRDFVGHGIGRKMHEDPSVPNYGKSGTGFRLEPGLVLAIEPMVTRGSWEVNVQPDGWTVVTKDGSMAAHFEHSIAVTEDGPLVLTRVI